LTRLAFALAGIASAAAVLVAAAVIWLCLTEPATVATAVRTGADDSVLRVVAALIASAVGRLVHYL